MTLKQIFLTEFDAFLSAIVITIIFVIVVVIAIMSFNISDAILVVVFAIIICAVGLWVFLNVVRYSYQQILLKQILKDLTSLTKIELILRYVRILRCNT